MSNEWSQTHRCARRLFFASPSTQFSEFKPLLAVFHERPPALIDACIASVRGRPTGGRKNRAPVGRPRTLAMQTSIGPRTPCLSVDDETRWTDIPHAVLAVCRARFQRVTARWNHAPNLAATARAASSSFFSWRWSQSGTPWSALPNPRLPGSGSALTLGKWAACALIAPAYRASPARLCHSL